MGNKTTPARSFSQTVLGPLVRWEVAAGRVQQMIERGKVVIYKMAVHPDGNQVVLIRGTTMTTTLLIWDVRHGTPWHNPRHSRAGDTCGFGGM